MVRHLVSIADLSSVELKHLVSRAIAFKRAIQSGNYASEMQLRGQQVALLFNKRSTRTRISTEGAVTYLGGNPLFLGKDDVQLGVNETLLDSAKVISSMTSAIVARVGPHSDIIELCKHSRVPVINALCELYHPTQAIADAITIQEAFGVVEGLKVAWIGDDNNVLHDLALACVKLGINISIATPEAYPVSRSIKKLVEKHNETKSTVEYTVEPEKALRDANVVVTDTWVSMGQESEKQQRLKQFEGYQITRELLERSKVAKNYKFMHCLPRKPEEVNDEVFYSDNSLVFQEAENRLYSAVAVLEAFVVKDGQFA